MKNNIVTIAIGILSLLLVAAVVVVIAGEDKTGPVITITIPQGQQITYASGEDKKKLISYAKAVDEKDGDVSDTIMIEDIYVMSDFLTAKVVYVARDRDNNIARYNQVVQYLATKEELEELAKNAEDATAVFTTSKYSTEITKSSETSKTQAATSDATTAASAKPVITLTQTEVTLTQGDAFSVNSYIKDITDDKDTRSVLFTRIIIGGSYDMKTAGDYTVTIYCSDTEGNSSNQEKFIIHVQSKVAIAPTEAPTEAPVVSPIEVPAVVPTEAPTQAPAAPIVPVVPSTTEPALSVQNNANTGE